MLPLATNEDDSAGVPPIYYPKRLVDIDRIQIHDDHIDLDSVFDVCHQPE